MSAKKNNTNKPKSDKENKDKVEKPANGDKKGRPKDGLNDATRNAGLNFNVLAFRTWMKSQLAISGIKEDELPKFKGAHVALSAANEAMCLALFNATMKHLQKQKLIVNH